MTVSVSAYGVQVSCLPEVFPSFPVNQDAATLDWASNFATVPSHPPVWADEGVDRLTVGWANYAEFDLSLEKARVDVRYGAIGEIEAAFAFLLSVLPLAMPL